MKRYWYPAFLLVFLLIIVFKNDETYHAPKQQEEIPEPVVEYRYLSPYVTLSPYDRHFREAADSTGIDWILFAAIAFAESRFDSTAVSSAGAMGVMQMMPNTLERLGIPDSMYMNTRTNIMASAELLSILNHTFRKVDDFDERLSFILASYNAGIGQVRDAQRLADKYGKSRHVWHNSVDSFLILKSLPEYYSDSVCRTGAFNGWRETSAFINKVKRNYQRFQKRQLHYNDSIHTVAAGDSTIIIKEI